jgi:histidine triad (HIT) family protein
MKDCIFCKIIAGEIPSVQLYEDADLICIRDIQPQAKVHLLVIPKTHIPSLAEVPEEKNAEWMGSLMHAAVKIAREQKLLPDGFRTVINTGAKSGQTVFHLHLHLLGGEPLRGEFG